MPLQLRDPRTGKVFPIAAGTGIEITDQQGAIALLIRVDGRGVVQLVTANEEADIAQTYSKHFGVPFSRLAAPDLQKLKYADPVPLIQA